MLQWTQVQAEGEAPRLRSSHSASLLTPPSSFENVKENTKNTNTKLWQSLPFVPTVRAKMEINSEGATNDYATMSLVLIFGGLFKDSKEDTIFNDIHILSIGTKLSVIS
jgi:hypothetical protein